MSAKWCLFLFGVSVMARKCCNDPAANQIVTFRDNATAPVGIMTTPLGAPINYYDASGTLNRRLIYHEFFLSEISHFNRERIPPRNVHAKGAGAFGYFQVTHDLTDFCKAKLFNKVGKITPVAVRFSPTIEEIGGIDTSRDIFGFSVKFYTEDGNFDIPGLSSPMFTLKDPLFFPSFIRARKNNPQTNMRDPNMVWDFIVQHPESLHAFLRVFGDFGIPDGYRYMPGFGIHTYQVVNEEGEMYFVKFHFIPDQGIKNLTTSEAQNLAVIDRDYAVRDLFNAIDKGNYPSWTLSVQVLSMHDIKTAEFDVFDITRLLSEDKYPLRPVGRLVLNQNPENYFADVELLAFCPGNLVPGILGAPDKIFEARRFAYKDTQVYRLGANFEKIAVNMPKVDVLTYERDGRPPVRDNQRNIPNYFPNSYHGPIPYIEKNRVDLLEIFERPASNLDQTRELYHQMSPGEQARVVENALSSIRLADVTDSYIQEQAVKLFSAIDRELGRRVWEGLQINKSNKKFDYQDCF